jgi:hypothetical protein
VSSARPRLQVGGVNADELRQHAQQLARLVAPLQQQAHDDVAHAEAHLLQQQVLLARVELLREVPARAAPA